jgi:hypothetical protein
MDIRPVRVIMYRAPVAVFFSAAFHSFTVVSLPFPGGFPSIFSAFSAWFSIFWRHSA